MIQRAVEITGDGRHLRKERGFLLICEHKEELGRIPLDDLEVVLAAGHGMTCTGDLLNSLAERCIPFVVCDNRFLPTSILWPLESHHLQSGRIRTQAGMSLPVQKRLWKQLVKAKIMAQHTVLSRCTGSDNSRILRLSQSVQSGDPQNAEGEAARLYWPLLFGEEFRRNREHPGINALLNYGYTILRSAVARAVMLAGLHPAFGLHHHSLRDTMPLVDDLIEPFRPVVDLLVFELIKKSENAPELDRSAKQTLVGVPTIDMEYGGIASPVSECLLRLTRSLADICEGRQKKLLLPAGFRVLNSSDSS